MSSMGNNKIRLHLDGDQTSFRLLLPQKRKTHNGDAAKNTALQSPDVSRMQLAAALRKLLRLNTDKAPRKSAWAAFQTRVISSSANSNNK